MHSVSLREKVTYTRGLKGSLEAATEGIWGESVPGGENSRAQALWKEQAESALNQ